MLELGFKILFEVYGVIIWFSYGKFSYRSFGENCGDKLMKNLWDNFFNRFFLSFLCKCKFLGFGHFVHNPLFGKCLLGFLKIGGTNFDTKLFLDPSVINLMLGITQVGDYCVFPGSICPNDEYCRFSGSSGSGSND